MTSAGTAADAVVALAKTAKIGKCLVLFPYDVEHKGLYASSIRRAVAKHMVPVSLADIPQSAAISALPKRFGRLPRSSPTSQPPTRTSCTRWYAHGLGLTPLLYTRNAARLDELPVYFKTLNVRVASGKTTAAALIGAYLHSVKNARRVHQPMV